MYVEIDPTQLKRLASEGKMARKSQRIESTGENAWLQALLILEAGYLCVWFVEAEVEPVDI